MNCSLKMQNNCWTITSESQYRSQPGEKDGQNLIMTDKDKFFH